jgi:hypothetical protein
MAAQSTYPIVQIIAYNENDICFSYASLPFILSAANALMESISPATSIKFDLYLIFSNST